MIDVAKTVECGDYLLAVVEPHQRTLGIDRFDCSELAVGDAERPVGCPELDALSLCDGALLLAEDLDAEEPGGIVLDATAIGRRDREQVGLAINRFDAGVGVFGNRGLFASTGEADHIAFFIVISDRPLDSRKAAIH